MVPDKATLKKIDTIYKTTQQMPLVLILGLLFPVILLAAGGLSFVYASWRKNILAAIDAGQFVAQDEDKIQYIREHRVRLLLPGYVLLGMAGTMLILLLMAKIA